MENPGNKETVVRNTLKKEERLCSKKIIDRLFAEGTSFLCFPLKIVYLQSELPTKYSVQAAFTVSKKNFKKAVKRNLLKRRMRESYRTNKHTLYKESNKQLAVFFIYIGKEIIDYQRIEAAMKKALTKLQKETKLENDGNATG